ncbi:MAG TPA: hypothetical protein PLS93_01680 [Accumulibacter sp.]|nr:hypothetical protein [Accumulibacter sp.]
MIETTHIRLNKAAEILNTDADTVLIAGSEGRVRLYWLLNRPLHAELGHFHEPSDPPPDEPPVYWVTEGLGFKFFFFIPLDSMEAAELLKKETITAKASALTEQDTNGRFWMPAGGWAVEGGGLVHDDLHVTRDAVFLKRTDIECIGKRGVTPSAGTVLPLPSHAQRGLVSDKLAILSRAAATFWANVDRDDRSTHPKNASVAAWLMERGYSKTLADQAASIIRPEWAPTGRKAEE